jgi:hypothetical protein
VTESTVLAAFFFPCAAAVIVFFMKYMSAILQARVRLGQDEAYRAIADRAVAGQAETASALAALGRAVTDIQAQLGGITKILKDVE